MKKRHLKRLLGVAMYEIDSCEYLYKQQRERAERMEDEDAGSKQAISRLYDEKLQAEKALTDALNKADELSLAVLERDKLLAATKRKLYGKGQELALAKEQLAERQTEVNLMVAEIGASDE